MNVWVNGIKVHVDVRGKGEPILFLHGFPLRGDMWDPVLDELEGTYRLIIPDLRGHGQSDATKNWTIADLAEDQAGLLEEIDETHRVVVVGASMGGYVALEFCRFFESCVRGVVLVDTRAEADTAEAAKARRETAEKVLHEGPQVVANSMIERLFAPSCPSEVREHWRRVMLSMSPEGMAGALRAMAGRSDSYETLRRLRVPTLIVVGEQDVITPSEHSKRMHEATVGSELVVMPGVGHMPPIEAPKEFAEHMELFLKKVYAARRNAEGQS